MDLYYYVVNYLYPYVALQPMPGIECTKENFLIHGSSIDNLFGFYYCEIITLNDLYIRLLPYKTKDGLLLFPLGK
jgi:hypothetical protein